MIGGSTMRTIVWTLFALVTLVGNAEAFTCTPTGCTFNAKYTEPTTVNTGAPLTNLSSTTVSYQIAVDGAAPGAAKTVSVPASSPNGGGAIVKAIVDPALVRVITTSSPAQQRRRIQRGRAYPRSSRHW